MISEIGSFKNVVSKSYIYEQIHQRTGLCVTANVVYSDHANSIALDMGYKMPTEVPNEEMALSCYRKAVEKLKDPDAGFHVRKHFKSKMYDDSEI